MKVSILGTCPECLHYADGMCDLRPRICLNYDHFERRPMVTLTRDDFEKLYISRAAYDELNAKVAALTAALEEANSALISMVYQYCYRPLDANKEPAIDIYQHDFMSAGEEAFAYLVEHGVAKWTDESHYAILINSKTSHSVKSDD